jgi:hypothetical protein
VKEERSDIDMTHLTPPIAHSFFGFQVENSTSNPRYHAIMKRLLSTLVLLVTLTASAADLVTDDFASAKHPKRKAQRGPWQFQDGTARCVQDDTLFEKFKNHGPILFYDTAFTDAVITFQFKPEAGCKTFVFTVNGAEGHVFRFVSSTRGTGFRAFPPSPNEHSSIALGKTGPALKLDAWTSVKVTLAGTKATVQIGDTFVETTEHASLARPKTNLSLGFSYGSMSFKDLRVSTP